MIKRSKQYLWREDGSTLVEYSATIIIGALIILSILGFFVDMSVDLLSQFENWVTH